MEIKQEGQKPRRRGRFLWVLLVANIALVIAIWQYHRVIVEVSDGAATDLYKGVLHPFDHESDLSRFPLRVALVQSEYTAASFGDNRDNYYNLIRIWERLLSHEGFGYHTLSDIPTGPDVDNYNLLVLPAATCLSSAQRDAVKSFLRAGKGLVMTWASGTRNEYGEWERFSLLQEIGGMDVVGPPPVSERDISTAMLSGGYPITADLYPGFRLSITRFDQPISCFVREERTNVDGVWSDVNDPSFELHSVRDRAAVTHGEYLGGRFVWLGFTVGSSRAVPLQQDAFFRLVRNSMIWAGHQVLAFKPVWPGKHNCVVSVTQNIYGPEDVDLRLLALFRKHRVPVTSFIRPDTMTESRDLIERLASVGEIGLLGNPGSDYRAMSLSDQQHHFTSARRAIKRLCGENPVGFRPVEGQQVSEHTLDALIRSGYTYISTPDCDRMVPMATRSYRKVALVTRPTLLWTVPEMPKLRGSGMGEENTMLAHFSQINALNGYYCLSFRPSQVEVGFSDRLDVLLERVKRENVLLESVHGVTKEWRGWDQVKMTTRLLSPNRTSLKISNTGRENVKNISMHIEMPRIVSDLDIESMTLGTALPDSLSHDGVNWRLHLRELSGGKNVMYYLELPPNGAIKPLAAN